jgi:hypothetical protein
MAQLDRPWYLQKERVRLVLTVAALERIDGVAVRLGLSRGRVVDALVRVVPAEDLDRAVQQAIDTDARALSVWRDVSTPS